MLPNEVIEVVSKLPAQHAVLLKGPTGVGKSHIVKDLCKYLSTKMTDAEKKQYSEYHLIDVRLSQMGEADISGLPNLKEVEKTGVASYALPAWYVKACEVPCVLFFDEQNRATRQVQQGVFQIVLDRQLGNQKGGVGLSLHPLTRVVSAVNVGKEYDVTAMDPALLRRFVSFNIDTDLDQWCKWASKNDHDPMLIEFLKTHPKHFHVDPSEAKEEGATVPCPASWSRLDECLRQAGMNLSKKCGTKLPHLYQIVSGYVGIEAAQHYERFHNETIKVSFQDVLAGKVSKAKSKTLKAVDCIELIEQCFTYLNDPSYDLSDDDKVERETGNMYEFVRNMNDEILQTIFKKAMEISGSHIQDSKSVDSFVLLATLPEDLRARISALFSQVQEAEELANQKK